MSRRPARRGTTREQREALTSPLRLEILGQFTGPAPLSVRDLAERMGRTPHSIYYHVHLLARVGLLREVGLRPGGAGRGEALYRPVQDTIRVDSAEPGAEDTIRRTMAAAFRMAQRDLDSALESASRRAPADPPGLATRLHFRATPRAVTGIPAAAGPASALEIPGITSHRIRAARHAATSSLPRPKTKGSPPLSRTTSSPRRARATSSRLISSCASGA
jgi:hypothetical protein